MDEIILGALAVPYHVQNQKYQILLLKHRQAFWTLPGGKKDNTDPDLVSTQCREIQEEIGWTINPQDLIYTQIVNHFTYGPEKPDRRGKPGETHFYLLPLKHIPPISLENKMLDYSWYSPQQTLSLIQFPDERRALQKVFKLLQNHLSIP